MGGVCGRPRGNRLLGSSNVVDSAVSNVNRTVADIKHDTRKVAEEFLYPICGCICFNIFLNTRDAIGVRCLSKFLCVDCAFCLHPGAPNLDCYCFDCHFSRVSTLCSGQYQTCCLVESFSMPPKYTETIPLINVCGMNLYPKIACCQTTQGMMMRV